MLVKLHDVSAGTLMIGLLIDCRIRQTLAGAKLPGGCYQ
jgi:hypothetical protein